MRLVRQSFDTPRERDIEGAVQRELGRLGLGRTIRPNDSVAVTVGSRGITNLPTILREVVAHLREIGARPFLIPTMGSHGGGTAAGQREVIEGYGVTEEAIQAPIRASMDVVEVGRHAFGGPVYLDAIAATADHIAVVARVKPHTTFGGKIQSGLCKMMMIGLGKHVGALAYHRELMRRPWEPYIRSVAEVLLATGKIRFGLAIVENAADETGHIEAAMAEGMIDLDERMLTLATAWMPRLPFTDADLLIIDEIGKDKSGAGFDPNVLGRKEDSLRDEQDGGRIRRIFVRGLSPKTHGNATGIGMADFTTQRVVDGMDYHATVTNCLTANRPGSAAVPVHYPSDRQALVAALSSVGLDAIAEAKVLWIPDTLRLTEVGMSRNYEGVPSRAPLEDLGPADFAFDPAGNLLTPWREHAAG